MFGLSFEKLLLVAVLAACILGPQRLPAYTAKLARLVRSVRRLLDTAKQNAEADLGIPLERHAYQFDLRQYDPRTIVRDALHDPTEIGQRRHRPDDARPEARPDTAPVASTALQNLPTTSAPVVEPSAAPLAVVPVVSTPEAGADLADPDGERLSTNRKDPPAGGTAVRGRWLASGGSSGHPRRILINEPATGPDLAQ